MPFKREFGEGIAGIWEWNVERRGLDLWHGAFYPLFGARL